MATRSIVIHNYPARAVRDSYGAAFERDGKWFLSWGGRERGPFGTRAEALAAKSADSFAEAIEHLRGGSRQH